MPEASVFTDVSIDCARVEQQTRYYCGAACSEMVLRKYGIPCNQPEAYAKIHSADRFVMERLYSDPLGLSTYLNAALSSKVEASIEIFAATQAEDILSSIYYTLKFLKLPTLVLVQNGDHWVVVDAIRVREVPGHPPEIAGVFVENPWFDIPTNKYISADEFVAGWLTPNRWGVTWKDKIVALSNSRFNDLPAIRSLPALTIRRFSASWPSSGKNTAPDLDDQVSAALIGHGFTNITTIGGGGGALQSPITVIDVDTGKEFIVAPRDAVAAQEFSDFVYVAVDKLTNDLLEVSKFSRAVQIHTDIEAITAVRTTTAATAIQLEPGYFWQRTYEAMSRFQLFRRVRIDGVEMFLSSNGGLTREPAGTHLQGGG